MKLLIPNKDIILILNYLRDNNTAEDNACVTVKIGSTPEVAQSRIKFDRYLEHLRSTLKHTGPSIMRAMVDAHRQGLDQDHLILLCDEKAQDHVHVITLIGDDQEILTQHADYIKDFAESEPYRIEDLEVLTYCVQSREELTH